jgi:WXG100 family type VII secretion target
MSDVIHYNFGQISDSLGEIQSRITQFHQLQDDVAQVVNAMEDAYKGSAPEAMQQQMAVIKSKMDDAAQQLDQLQRSGHEQADSMQHLDKLLASRY